MTGPGAGVLVAVARPLAADALRSLLRRQRPGDRIWQASDGPSAVRRLASGVVDVVLVDAGIPPGGAAQVCAACVEDSSRAAPLVLYPDPSVEDLWSALRMGAVGVLGRAATPEGVAAAVEAVRCGGSWVPTDLLRAAVAAESASRDEDRAVVARYLMLTVREREVVALLAEGLGGAAIAARLYVSPHTVRTHVQRILRKLETHSRLEAIALLRRYALLERFAPREPRETDASDGPGVPGIPDASVGPGARDGN